MRRRGQLSTTAPRLAGIAATILLVACGSPAATPPPPIPLDDRLIAAIEMPGDPDWLVAGFGSVWVKRDDGNVARIDPTSHEIVATIDADVTDPGLCQGIGSDGASIWACSGPNIVRIDPVTNAVVDVVEARKIFVQGRLVFAAGQVWVINGESGDRLVGIDVETLEAGDPIILDAACYDLAVGAGSIWVACPPSNLVLRVDPVTAAVSDRIEVASPYQVSVGGDAAWAATPEGVARIDLDDDGVRSIPMAAAPADEGGIWADASSVWVRTADVFLTRIDAATSRIGETIASPDHGPGDIIGLDGSLWASDYVNGWVVHLRADAP